MTEKRFIHLPVSLKKPCILTTRAELARQDILIKKAL